MPSAFFDSSGEGGSGPSSREYFRVNALPFGGTFAETQPLVEEGGYALINDSVADAETIPTAAENAPIDEPLKLV